MEELSANSLKVMQAKYLKKNEKGEVIETPEDCFRRVAHAVAQVEETPELKKIWEEKFFQVMANLEFLPGGRTLANAGTNYPQLANCFVLPMEDNIEEIFEVVKDSSILKKFGGGVGFSFSKIRPKNDSIAGTSGSACGPVALMKIINAASEIFMQDGKRRSGNMVVLLVSHPDILDFITIKKDKSTLAQINYSLGVPDKFMQALINNKTWDLINPRTGRAVSRVKARSIFEVATAMAWEGGDPGMVFLDTINRDNPAPNLGPIEAVNLCGEQPLLAYEACNLGSINLTKFIKGLGTRGERLGMKKILAANQIDWEHLTEVIEIATRFLDDVIDAGRYPLAKVDRMVKANRKIGLGVMGWANLLTKLQIPYNSKEALNLAERVMKLITQVSHEASQKLGREKGSFPNFDGSKWSKKTRYMRNATCTTIAPTGSISMVAGVSSGIEPLFALSYYKEVLGGARFPEVNGDLLNQLDKLGKDAIVPSASNRYSRYAGLDKKDIILKTGTIADIKEIPENIRRIFVTAHEISYEWHIKMQAAFQKYTDNAVSKTINLLNTATVEDVEKAFILAWKLGCKGITIYRDKSRQEQVLNVGDGQSAVIHKPSVTNHDVCPKCHGKLVREEGCMHCPKCGFSACEL